MNNSPEPRSVVPGSERIAPAGHRPQPATDDLARDVEITVTLRRRREMTDDLAALAARPHAAREHVSREAFAERYGASAEDIAAVVAFARASDLRVVATSAARRSVVLGGSLGDVARAFGARLVGAAGDGGAGRTSREGSLTVPRSLADIVVAVLGIDDRPQASAQFRFATRPAAAAVAGLLPTAVARAYDFPTGVDGTGQTVAIVELGGGFVQGDLDAYFAGLGTASPTVVAVGVDGAANAPTNDPNGPDGEVALDIEVVGAIAPGAKIAVYFAPNTDRGFLDAVTTAVHDTTNKPTIVSISWGGPESSWTSQAIQSLDAAFADAAMLGVSVLVAAGDHGSSDGVTDGLAHVDFPASSPHATACGGTLLALDGAGAIASESVWNDGSAGGATGGGVSDVFALPAFQNAAKVPPSTNAGARVGRGVPDVAGDADPNSGYRIRIDGRDGVVGGTSAVAPLWAALVALANQRAGKAAGFLNPTLYANAAAFRDITSGDNGTYAATAGWDACTGLGSPDGAKIAALFGP